MESGPATAGRNDDAIDAAGGARMRDLFTTPDGRYAFEAAIVVGVMIAIVAGGLRGVIYLLTRLIRFVNPAVGDALWSDFKEYVAGNGDLSQCAWALVFLICLLCRARDIQRSETRAATRTSESTPAAPDVEAPGARAEVILSVPQEGAVQTAFAPMSSPLTRALLNAANNPALRAQLDAANSPALRAAFEAANSPAFRSALDAANSPAFRAHLSDVRAAQRALWGVSVRGS
jgi:hypothetical protein